MTDIRTITLGGREFPVPLLPPKANRIVFPLCVKLEDFVQGTIKSDGGVRPSVEQYDDMADALYAAISYKTQIAREEFDELAMTPGEMFAGLLTARLCTGGWVITKPGEAQGEKAAESQ